MPLNVDLGVCSHADRLLVNDGHVWSAVVILRRICTFAVFIQLVEVLYQRHFADQLKCSLRSASRNSVEP